MEPLSTPWRMGSPGEIPSSDLSERATMAATLHSPWRRRLGEPDADVCVVHVVEVGGCRGGGPGCLMFVRRGGGLGKHGWKRLHEKGKHLNMAWVAILCR